MNDFQKINITEYSSLRSETCTRIEIMNSQSTSALTTALATWVIGFTLLGFQVTSKPEPNNIMTFLLPLGQIVAFLSSIIMLLPMASKSGENLQQMVSLGAYIRIFHDEASQTVPNDSPKFYWETVDKKMNSLLNSNSNSSKIIEHTLFRLISKSAIFNSEYVCLSLVSNAFFLLAGIDFIYSLYIAFRSTTTCMVAVILLVFVEFLMIITIREINRISSGRLNLMETYRTYLVKYFEFAVYYGIFDIEKAQQVWNDINQDKTLILNKKLRQTLNNIYYASNRSHNQRC